MWATSGSTSRWRRSSRWSGPPATANPTQDRPRTWLLDGGEHRTTSSTSYPLHRARRCWRRRGTAGLSSISFDWVGTRARRCLLWKRSPMRGRSSRSPTPTPRVWTRSRRLHTTGDRRLARASRCRGRHRASRRTECGMGRRDDHVRRSVRRVRAIPERPDLHRAGRSPWAARHQGRPLVSDLRARP
jgi:hypothetical protein